MKWVLKIGPKSDRIHSIFYQRWEEEKNLIIHQIVFDASLFCGFSVFGLVSFQQIWRAEWVPWKWSSVCERVFNSSFCFNFVHGTTAVRIASTAIYFIDYFRFPVSFIFLPNDICSIIRYDLCILCNKFYAKTFSYQWTGKKILFINLFECMCYICDEYEREFGFENEHSWTQPVETAADINKNTNCDRISTKKLH